MRGASQPLFAGAIAGIVGFASTFTLVLAGLRSVGASDAQAASGLFALCLTMGLCGLVLSTRTRMPISIAWSTPGAALLISSSEVAGGWEAAVGAFLVVGVLVVLTGLWRGLGPWIGRIPPAVASAMLAGVLLPVCLAPVRAVADIPQYAVAPVVAWALLMRLARRWAVPGAMLVTAVVIAIDPVEGGARGVDLLPSATLTAPAFTFEAFVSIALPLFVVTMASQNVPGMAVLAANGYRPRLRPLLVGTGAATVVGAPLGAHAVNLAAITAALVAGPEAGPDRSRRWLAGVSNGTLYLVLGPAAGLATALVAASPPLLVEAIAGLALLGALASALAAMVAAEHREAAVITFVVSASGIVALGISAPFWGLVAGLAWLGLERVGRVSRRATEDSAAG